MRNMSTSAAASHPALRDVTVGASGVLLPATAQITSNDILTWVSILYVVALLVFMGWKWYWLQKRVRLWEERLATDPNATPPALD